MMLSLAALAHSQVPADPSPPKAVDSAYVSRLRLARTLSPQEAVVVVAWRLRGLKDSNDDVGVGVGLRREIEDTANRVSWPTIERLPAFSAYVQDAYERLTDLGAEKRYPTALALVCAAWDLSLGRRQVVQWITGMTCLDRSARLIRGTLKRDRTDYPASSYLSPDWPWRRRKERLVLGPFELPGLRGGGPGMDARMYVRIWTELDRKRGW